MQVIQVVQQKTEKHGEAAFIKIEIGDKLKHIIKRCQDDVLSPYLIHHQPERAVESKDRDHYTKILPSYLNRRFAKIRDTTGLFTEVPAKERPTFHEIRSLGIKLYSDRGLNAQKLAGHTTQAMTDAYKKGHEVTWTQVASL